MMNKLKGKKNVREETCDWGRGIAEIQFFPLNFGI